MYYCSHITFIVRSVMRPASITRKRRWGREIPIQPDRHRDWKFGVQLLTRLFRSLNDTQYSLIENPSRLAYLLTGDIKPSITRIEKMSLCGCLPTWHTQILRVYSVPTSLRFKSRRDKFLPALVLQPAILLRVSYRAGMVYDADIGIIAELR